jgi:hypothetical protein
MSWRLLVLDDDPVRLAAFDGYLHRLGGEWRLKAWTSAEEMLAELDDSLQRSQFVSLDAALAPPVVERLTQRAPACPITIHWRHRTRDLAWVSFKRLSAAGWQVELVQYFNESWDRMRWLSDWLRSWQRAMHDLLGARADTRANRVHAANCERLRAQFEGREAIYFEKYVRRVKVWAIRAHVDARHVTAMAEELVTPGLGAPTAAALPPWWRFGGGPKTRFSRDSWSLGAQHVSWEAYFAPDFVAAVVGLAATLPSEDVYQSDRLMQLIRERGGACGRNEELVFPN